MHQYKELQSKITLLNEYTALTSPYDWRIHPIYKTKEFHKGVDLTKSPKSPIKAFVDGKVIHAGMGKDGSGIGQYGITVVIKDKNNHLHIYAHLDSVAVKVGQYIEIGQTIGVIGNTGASKGIHLHYEVRPFGNKPSFGYGDKTKPWTFTVDPLEYVIKYYTQNNLIIVNKPVDKGVHPVVNKFKDGHLISTWARDAMLEMSNLGLMIGDEKGNVNPLKPVTKEELAVIISRLMKVK